MSVMLRACGAGLVAMAAVTSAHAANPAVAEWPMPAAGVEIWSSTDSDRTTVVKLLGRALWDFEGPAKFQGIDVERAWFAPQGQHARKRARAYVDLADSLGGKWNWTARIGTDGSTILGAASIHSIDWRKEIFVEREIVETPQGVDKGIYYTFAGASDDVLTATRDNLNVMAGFQKFTGRNERLHVRGTFVHVVKPKLGISIQLRARYFHSTVPGEFDYFSPRNFFELIPVVQMRRFSRSGWMFLIAAGYGAQKATASGWQTSRIADFRIESPQSSHNLHAFLQLQYSNSSLVNAASNYRYVSGRLGLTGRF
jgi:hypothetical protein